MRASATAESAFAETKRNHLSGKARKSEHNKVRYSRVGRSARDETAAVAKDLRVLRGLEGLKGRRKTRAMFALMQNERRAMCRLPTITIFLIHFAWREKSRPRTSRIADAKKRSEPDTNNGSQRQKSQTVDANYGIAKSKKAIPDQISGKIIFPEILFKSIRLNRIAATVSEANCLHRCSISRREELQPAEIEVEREQLCILPWC